MATRTGRNGVPFKLYKFRSMTNAVDQGGKLLPDDQRITAYGRLIRKTSLDELPQLFNIVRGDMSLVGPRPLPMQYNELYDDEQKKRMNVLPGLTGWTQVHFSGTDRTWEKKLQLDIYYVEHQSFFLDLYIVFLTFSAIVTRFFKNKSGLSTSNEDFHGKQQ